MVDELADGPGVRHLELRKEMFNAGSTAAALHLHR